MDSFSIGNFNFTLKYSLLILLLISFGICFLNFACIDKDLGYKPITCTVLKLSGNFYEQIPSNNSE